MITVIITAVVTAVGVSIYHNLKNQSNQNEQNPKGSSIPDPSGPPPKGKIP